MSLGAINMVHVSEWGVSMVMKLFMSRWAKLSCNASSHDID